MEPPQTILENLKDIDQYLAQFHQSQQSMYFEQLIAEAFSYILYLPYFTSDNENTNNLHRVTWQGSVNSVYRSPRGKPDAIAYCYDFNLIIEATKNTGVNQWAKEFAQAIRHCQDFCSQACIQQKDTIVLLICTKLHRDTYISIKNNPKREYKLIPIEASGLFKILETSILAFTMRHLELRRLLNQISEYIKSSSSLDDFQSAEHKLISNWQENVLKVEKNTFVGIKSYEAMCQTGRTNVSAGDILSILIKNPIVHQYFEIIHDKPSVSYIEEGLLGQSLGILIGKTLKDEEPLFEPVHSADFKARGKRLIEEAEKIYG